MYYLYILRCADDTLYTGITTDVARRTEEHNGASCGAKYTRGRRPCVVVYTASFPDRAAATREELRIKRLSRTEKIIFIDAAPHTHTNTHTHTLK